MPAARPTPDPLPPVRDPAPRSRTRTRLLLGGAVAVPVVLLGLWGAAYAAAGSGIPKGTTVAGIRIGGLSEEEAAKKLVAELPNALARKVTVTAGEQSFTVEVANAGLKVDPTATLAKAGKRSMNPAVLIPTLFGGEDRLAPVTIVDEKKLKASVAKIAKKVNRPVVEGRVTFSGGSAKIRKAQVGRTLDVAETVKALRVALVSTGEEVEARVAEKKPKIGAAAVEEFMTSFAGPATSGPIAIALDGRTVSLRPTQYVKYLKIATTPDGRLEGSVDVDAIRTELEADYPAQVTPPVDASYRFKDGKPDLVPGKDGEAIDPVTFAERFNAVLRATSGRTMVADVVAAEPKLTTEAAANLGIVEKISTFKTEYPIAAYRVTNIGRAAELINGSLVLPGEIWSLNKRVGERTRANGFVKGFVINKGVFAEDLGGGVSQSATTTFNAVFFAGLKDIEHHAHSLYISRYPAGREATVAFGSKDLRFQNDMPTGVLIQAEAKPGSIRVTMWGTKIYDRIESISSGRYNFRSPTTIRGGGSGCVPTSPSSGFDIDVTRVFYKDGKVVRREKFHTRYEATDRVIC
ncbi:MAG: VanW family protein [Sporichthyaceae bacterium]